MSSIAAQSSAGLEFSRTSNVEYVIMLTSKIKMDIHFINYEHISQI